MNKYTSECTEGITMQKIKYKTKGFDTTKFERIF